MDELEISGKRYISSKRIAKENKYHSDYIGQLIRGGKILGTKVGRAWYVEERSFADYLNKESKTYISPAPSATPVQIVAKTYVPAQEPSSPQRGEFPVENSPMSGTVVPTNVSAKPVPAPTEYVVPIRKEEVFISEPVRSVPIKKTGLTYISDSGPLFPAIQKRTNDIPRTVPAAAIYVAPAEKPVVIVEERRVQKRNPFVTALAVTGVTALGAVVLAFTFFGSLGLDTTVTVQKGQTASVSYSQEKTLCFIFGNCQNGQQ